MRTKKRLFLAPALLLILLPAACGHSQPVPDPTATSKSTAALPAYEAPASEVPADDPAPVVLSYAAARQQLAIDPRAEAYRVKAPALGAGDHRCVVDVCVTSRGNVRSVRVRTTHNDDLARALIEKVPSWRYRPLVVDGTPVPFCHALPYVVSMRHPDAAPPSPASAAVAAADDASSKDELPRTVKPNVGKGLLLSDPTAKEHRPRIPTELANARGTKSAFLQVCVSSTGTPGFIRVVKSAHPKLDYAIVEAIRTWRYRPMSVDGNPKPFCYLLRFEVHLR